MSENKEIFKVMPALVAEVSAVGKDHTNTFHKYKYRSVDDLMAALHPLLGKHGVTIMPQYRDQTVSMIGGKEVRVTLCLELNWIASDGSVLVTRTYGEGIDNGDKATYKAMAGAMKYAILQTLCVPTEETRGKQDPEADPRTDEGSTPQRAGARTKKKDIPPPPAEDGFITTETSLEAALLTLSKVKTVDQLEAYRAAVRSWCLAKPKGSADRASLVRGWETKEQELGVEPKKAAQ